MSELPENKKDALRKLVNARFGLMDAGFNTSLTEIIHMDRGKFSVRLEIEGLSIPEANYLTSHAIGLMENAT